MENEITSTLSSFIASKILRQPQRIIEKSEPLISSGLVDSLSLMDLALFIEDKFGVRIEDHQLNKETFDTLDALAKIIEDGME